MFYLDRRQGLFSYGLIAMVVAHALVHAAGNMQGILFPLLKEEFVLSNQQIGIIAAIPGLAQVIFTLPVGMMSDKYGARRLVALSIIMAAVGALVAGFTINPTMYIVALVLLTLNSTFYHPPSHSYTTRLVEVKDRTKALGLLNAGGTFGVAVGPLSITILMRYFAFQWRQVYLFWVIPITLGLFLLFFIKDMPGAGSEKKGKVEVDPQNGVTKLLNRDFVIYLSASGVRQFAMSMITTFLSIFLVESRGWTIVNLGVMFGASSLFGLIASPIGGVLASRFGDKRWFVLTIGLGYIFYFAAFFVEGVIPFMLLYLAYRFCGILGMPASAAITAKLSPPEQMGMGFALSFLPMSIVRVIAPVIAAYIADYFGMFQIFMVSFVIMFFGLAVFQLGVNVDKNVPITPI